MLAERDAKIRELEETIKTLQSKLSVCESPTGGTHNGENMDTINDASNDAYNDKGIEEHNAEEDFVNIEPNEQW